MVTFQAAPVVIPVVVEEVPEFEIRGGLFYVTDRVRGAVTCVRAYPAGRFFEAFRKAADCCEEWRVEQAGKVEVLEHWRAHAASS